MLFPVRCALIFALLISAIALAAAQVSSTVSANVAKAAPGTVEVRFEMSWWEAPGSRCPRAVQVRLDPLDGHGPAQTVRISESSTTVVRVAPGRYQLTTTTPLTYDRQAYGWSIELPLTSPVNYVRLSTENAVRLAPEHGIEPPIIDARAARNLPSSTSFQSESEARAQINALLNRWVASLKSRSLKMQMACYAPRLTNYLQQGSLSSAQLERQKQKTFTTYTQIRRLELSNVELRIHGSQAVASAIKSWNFSNGEVDSHGRTLVNLGLAKMNGHWVITSEQEYAAPAPSLVTQPRLSARRVAPEC